MRIFGPNLFRVLGTIVSGDLGPLTFYTSKRHRLVWFPKAPPDKPPTVWQTYRRNIWRAGADSWRSLPQQERDNWKEATRRARLTITHYNLYLWWFTHDADASIRVLENNTRIKLLPTHWTTS